MCKNLARIRLDCSDATERQAGGVWVGVQGCATCIVMDDPHR